MIKVYIAGPYTNGGTAENVNAAIRAANTLADLGFAPYIPHLTHYWHLQFPRQYEFWLKLDLEFLACCDVLLRIPGESIGADKEADRARELGLYVFTSIAAIRIWSQSMLGFSY